MKLNSYVNKKRCIYYSILLLVTIISLLPGFFYSENIYYGYHISITFGLILILIVYIEIRISIIKTIYYCITERKRYDISEIVLESRANSHIVKKNIHMLINKGFLKEYEFVDDKYLKEIK